MSLCVSKHKKMIFVFTCDLGKSVNSFAGSLTLASVLLYPKTLGGGAVFSGWVPFNSSNMEQIPSDAKKVLLNAAWCSLLSSPIILT